MKESCPGKKRVTLPTESPLSDVYMRKKIDPFAEPTALAHALIVLTELTLELTRLGEPKC